MRLIILFAAAAGMIASSALADPATTPLPEPAAAQQQPTTPTQASTTVDDDPVECRYESYDRMLIQRKICYKHSRWQLFRNDQQRLLFQLQLTSYGHNW
jgi:hypothetical protein